MASNNLLHVEELGTEAVWPGLPHDHTSGVLAEIAYHPNRFSLRLLCPILAGNLANFTLEAALLWTFR
jgi:hypothetical protein